MKRLLGLLLAVSLSTDITGCAPAVEYQPLHSEGIEYAQIEETLLEFGIITEDDIGA